MGAYIAPGTSSTLNRTPSPTLSLLALHATLSLTFALIAGKPLCQTNNLAYLFVMSANACIAIPLSTIALVFAAHHLIIATRLSQTSLALQCAIYPALAALWPFRLTLPRNLSCGHGSWWVVTEWYHFVGWAGVNAGVAAVEQYLTLYAMVTPTE